MSKIIALSKSKIHTFSKINVKKLFLLKGLGVKGDVHMGEKVKHRSRVAKNPDQPNLRQIHLIQTELFEELNQKGFDISPGLLGENITTQGINLLELPRNTILKIGTTATIQITGLRNPCHQLNGIQKGLMNAVIDKDSGGNIIRKVGVMGIILESGEVVIDDKIIIQLPQKPYTSLDRV